MRSDLVESLFARAGVTVGGPDPWDIQVHDDRFYARVLAEKELGLGESYVDGWWDCPRIDEFVTRLLRARLDEMVRNSPRYLLRMLPAVLLNLQSRARSRKIAEDHYDLGNDFFLSFLDPYNQYSCAYFNGTDDLAETQRRKLDLICRKANIVSSDRVLDIGCGWGGFARYAAESTGCTVTAVNISTEQIYLLSCAGAFRARSIQLWQIVFTKVGRPQPVCR